MKGLLRVLFCLFLIASLCYGHGHGKPMQQAQPPMPMQGISAPQQPQQMLNVGQVRPGQQAPNQPAKPQMPNQPAPQQPIAGMQQPQQNPLPNNAVPNGALPSATPAPLSPSQQQSGSSLSQIFTAEHFNKLKAVDPNCQGAKLYTYEAFLQAATTLFPAFGTTGDLTARRRDVAGFFAHVMHETGLCFVDEQGAAAKNPQQYCQASAQYPCAPGANYHGRGPLQMTWNYNYIDFGKTLGAQQAADIYQHPEHVGASGVLLFQSALYFYMRQNTPDSMHNLLLRNPPAFGTSIKVINGALECNGGNSAQVASRGKYFSQICSMLGVDPGNQLTC